MGDLKIVLSICIPTYNRARCLRVLLQDIYNELSTFPFKYEIIISNNASSDDTDEVVESWLAKLPIVYIKQKENLGSLGNVAEAYARASGTFSMYLADDDFIDRDGLVDAIITLIGQPQAAVLYAPWKLISLQNKKSDLQFYQVPNDLVFEKGDYGNLLTTILNHHIFLEISIFRNSYYQKLRPAAHDVAYWAFTTPAEWISYGKVLIMKRHFYYASTQYFEGEKLEQQGNIEVEYAWDRYRGGLEYLLGRALPGLNHEKLSLFRAGIDEFVATRMLVALKMRILNNRNPIENYYLAARLCGLGKKEKLPVSYDNIRTEAVIWYLCNDKFLLRNKNNIVLIGKFDDALVSKVKSATVLNVFRDEFYSEGVYESSILLFSGDCSEAKFEVEKNKNNEIISEKNLLTKFL